MARDSEVKNLEAISKAIDAHNSSCPFPAVAVAMNPFEVERLGWEPEVELRDGLEKTIEHARTWAGVEQRAPEAQPVAGVSEPS